MATANLTDRLVRGFKTSEVQDTVMDSNLRGFGLRATKEGTKTFFLRYREGGKRRRYKIGRYPALSLADARDMARDILGRVARGEDPAEDRRQERREVHQGLTFFELAQMYLEEDSQPNKATTTYREEQRILLHGDVKKSLGTMKASEVTMADVVALLDRKKRKAPIMANRTRAILMAVYGWAISQPKTGITSSPMWGTRPPFRGEHRRRRDRVLSPDEIRKLWGALDDHPWRPASILKLTLLTGQRPGEVCSLRWSRISEDVWDIPAREYKGGHGHKVILNAPALKIIELAEVSLKDSPFLFPGDKEGPYRIQSLDQAVSRRVLPNMKEVEPWTPHDLRRTAFTLMGELGVSRQIRDLIAGHSDPSVGRHYDWYDYAPEIRMAMGQWGGRLEKILREVP